MNIRDEHIEKLRDDCSKAREKLNECDVSSEKTMHKRHRAVRIVCACVGICVALIGVYMIFKTHLYAWQTLFSEDAAADGLGHEAKTAYVEIPEEWTGYYHPKYIPKGFSVERVSCSEIANKVNYINTGFDNIWFCEGTQNLSVSYNTENCDVFNVDINGYEATVSNNRNHDRCYIVWSIDDRMLVLSSSLPYEEVLSIAESVTKIK